MKNIFVGVVVPYSLLLPILIALLHFRQLNKAAKVIFTYLICSGLVSLLSTYIVRYLHVNNLPLFHIYTLIEFILLTEFYKQLLPFRKTITIVQICFFFACVINSVFVQSIYQFNSYTLTLEALVVMLFAVNYFAKLFADINDKKLLEQSSFWFNIGLFLYFSGSYMLYNFSNYVLIQSKHSFIVVWNIRAAFLLLMYLLFTIGFWKCKK